VFRVLKPGAHLVAFAAPKNFDLMFAAIRAAGFEVRDSIFDLFSLNELEERFLDSLSPDQAEALGRVMDHREAFGALAWTFGAGFPKSHDVSKALDKAAGAKREKIAFGEPVKRMIPGADQNKAGWEKTNGREYQPGVEVAATDAARRWEGWGTALKPAIEPICLARKPLSESTVAANVLRWGTGSINIDGCRVGDFDPDAFTASLCASNGREGEASAERRYTNEGSTNFAAKPGPRGGSPIGRWPANVVHDGSPEVVDAFPDTDGQQGDVRGTEPSVPLGGDVFGDGMVTLPAAKRGDAGSAARFFYSSKADSNDRIGSRHPTVKPVDLMQWLVRLVCPPGGVVLDPFSGT
jgi:site-specific DNA-methyltransferase (adenine-specific)